MSTTMCPGSRPTSIFAAFFYFLFVLGLVIGSDNVRVSINQPIIHQRVSSHQAKSTSINLLHGGKNNDWQYTGILSNVFMYLNQAKPRMVKEDDHEIIRIIKKRSSEDAISTTISTPNVTNAVFGFIPGPQSGPIACPGPDRDCTGGRPNSAPTLNRHHLRNAVTQVSISSLPTPTTPVNCGLSLKKRRYSTVCILSVLLAVRSTLVLLTTSVCR
ncbi:uncharacterized protein [Antedon mediterranea]|uniref:uncharacterized protein n=1 Tax=Antedon mediterranea TaxID=105859 RepID=UPI003AF49299